MMHATLPPDYPSSCYTKWKYTLIILLILNISIASVIADNMIPEKVYKDVKDSVFLIVSGDKSPKMILQGSGVAVLSDVIATNCHVVPEGKIIIIKVENSFRQGLILFRNEPRDLCFVKVEGAKFNPVKIRSSAEVAIGEEVVAIGNPNGTNRTISRGLVSNKVADLILTDTKIDHGSSGGGLFDKNGYLIGITTLMFGQSNLGGAQSSDLILNNLNQIISGTNQLPASIEQSLNQIFNPPLRQSPSKSLSPSLSLPLKNENRKSLFDYDVAQNGGVTYNRYENEEYGYSLLYPKNFLISTQGEENTNPLVMQDPDSSFQLKIEVSSLRKDDFINLFNENKNQLENIAYTLMKENWFVISGYVHNEVHYVKCILNGNSLKKLTITYDKSQTDFYNRIVQVISPSFVEE